MQRKRGRPRTDHGVDIPLYWHTPPSWAEAVLEEPDALLSDHAHCELGAAAAAQSLLARRPQDAFLVERMGAHAVEELQHFRRVHRLLRARGGTLVPAEKNPYVAGLHRLIASARQAVPAATSRPTGGAPSPEGGDRGMVDRLLVAALVERRSLERFELLAQCDPEGELAKLYSELGPSEAGHARLFGELALRLGPPERVALRLEELARAESELIGGLPFCPRIHSGPPREN